MEYTHNLQEVECSIMLIALENRYIMQNDYIIVPISVTIGIHLRSNIEGSLSATVSYSR